MKNTANYQLNQWEQTDRILMADFNADNSKVDGALAGLQTALAGKADSATVSALQTAVAGCGNCKIWTTTYTGNGKAGSSNPCSVTFPGQPIFFCFLYPAGLHFVAGTYGCTGILTRVSGGGSWCPASWSGNTVSWYDSGNNPTNQMSEKNAVYRVIAFFAVE